MSPIQNLHLDLFGSGVFIIGGKDNRPGEKLVRNDTVVQHVIHHARTTRTIVAHLLNVPNQRLYFTNDPRMGESGREEDDIIAWTWRHFVDHPDEPDWLLRLPMTKAVRLAFDAVNTVFQGQKNTMNLAPVNVIDEFCVTGASKRGWTTWTIAAVDKRVKCAIPIVLDCLNMKEQFFN